KAGTDVGLIIEDLEELAENPININATNETQLSRLYILNDIQINKLLSYIDEFGPAYSIFELNTIDGFSPDLLLKMKPFIWFGPPEQRHEKFTDALKYGRHQLLIRGLGTTQKPFGYQEKEDGTIPYEGNQFRYYTRYRFEARDKLSVGFTAEKDPGEAFFRGSNKNGFDFYSGHLSVKINSNIEQITVGDFIVRSGQGLILWQEYSMGKTENVLNLSKTNRGVRPFTSVEENMFFRGVATTLKFGNARISLFYSQKNVDGNVIVGDSLNSFFTSLQTSGYHRTKNEIADKNSVQDRNAGGIFTWSFNYLKIGTTISYQHFNMPFIRSSQLYNQYRFRGTENITGGVDYLFSKGKYQLFGEAAISKSRGKAVIQGAVARLNDQLSFSMLFRHFDKNYHAYWSNTFTEGSTTNNETGIFFGTKILPLKFVTLSAYSDFYSSRWINYSTAGPSKGWDIFTQANFIFSQNFEFYIRYKNEEKELKFKKNELFVNLPKRLQKARFHIQYKPLETVTLKTRFEHAFYKGADNENGFMIFQDVQFALKKLPINVSARLAWFNTDSYNSRIYAYENDLLYTFSIPAYYGRGFRTYLNVKYIINDKLDFWFKVANTSWNDREIISSGNNKIVGNNKTELKFQLRLKI
ncbi:MAG: helix-hairpin-helix domain-containing protein, partial [Draconibacterium sp.]|nr:helix-hairpin-helix domain-containing protein [Draconibacterium sp.]